MIIPCREKVLQLHERLTFLTGGSAGIRDEGMLDSALESVHAGFGGREFYPTVEEKGARLGYALISDHAFVDGNKRIGVLLMLVFLEVNGVRVRCDDEELVRVGLSVADGSMRYPQLLDWVREHGTMID